MVTRIDGTEDDRASAEFRRQLGRVFRLHSFSGKGTYGRVVRVTDSAAGVGAVKIQDQGSDEWVYFLREVECLMDLQAHPNIVELRNVGFGDCSSNYRWILMEYVPETADIAMKQWNLTKRIALATRISHNILSALNYMHSMDLAHRDLKPSNILVDGTKPDYAIRLCDFGMSKNLREDYQSREVCTLGYRAPELLVGSRHGTKKYDCKVDIWSLGVTILDVVLGQYSFHRPSVGEVILALSRVFGGAYLGVETPGVPMGAKKFIVKHVGRDALGHQGSFLCDFLESALIVDPEDRPSADALLGYHASIGVDAISLVEGRGMSSPVVPWSEKPPTISRMSRRKYSKILRTVTNVARRLWLTKRVLMFSLELMDLCVRSADGIPSGKWTRLTSAACVYLASAYGQMYHDSAHTYVRMFRGEFGHAEFSDAIAEVVKRMGYRLSRVLDRVLLQSAHVTEESRYCEVMEWFLRNKIREAKDRPTSDNVLGIGDGPFSSIRT